MLSRLTKCSLGSVRRIRDDLLCHRQSTCKEGKSYAMHWLELIGQRSLGGAVVIVVIVLQWMLILFLLLLLLSSFSTHFSAESKAIVPRLSFFSFPLLPLLLHRRRRRPRRCRLKQAAPSASLSLLHSVGLPSVESLFLAYTTSCKQNSSSIVHDFQQHRR